MAEGLGTALLQALPPGTPISPDEIDAVAHRALADPRAMAALKTAVLASHQRLVGDYDGPVTVDVSPIAVAGRDALVAARPDLAGALPESPTLSVDLPDPAPAQTRLAPRADPGAVRPGRSPGRHAARPRATGRLRPPKVLSSGPAAGRCGPVSSGRSSAGPSPTP